MAGAEYARARLAAAVVGRADEIRAEVARNSRRGRNSQRRQERILEAALRPGDPAEDPWRDPGTLMAEEHGFDDFRFSLYVRDTGAALNLNEATEDMLRQFFAQGLGVDYTLAERVAQAIMDWRDEDDIPRLNGGEREQYLRDGAAVLPANRPFEEMAELRWVRGMSAEMFAAAQPYLTLTSSGRVNVNAAPEPVLLALPGVTPAAAAELIRLRQAGTLPRRDRDLEELLSPAVMAGIEAVENEFERRVTYSTDEVEIIADGWIDGSPVRVRTRTVVARAQTGATVVWRKLDR
jgi:general secretion pathway protein K